MSFDSLVVNAEWISLFKRAPVVREVRLHRPSVRIVRFEDNTYNFSDLMHKDAKKKRQRPCRSPCRTSRSLAAP